MASEPIVCTELEEQLFALLLQVVAHTKSGTTLRVAGGWVRDKLLGRESDDIDIALDNCSGQEFAEATAAQDANAAEKIMRLLLTR